jgi:hypothetical protein
LLAIRRRRLGASGALRLKGRKESEDMADVDPAQLEAFLRQVGLIEPQDSGSVEVKTSTSEGTQTVTITV